MKVLHQCTRCKIYDSDIKAIILNLLRVVQNEIDDIVALSCLL